MTSIKTNHQRTSPITETVTTEPSRTPSQVEAVLEHLEQQRQMTSILMGWGVGSAVLGLLWMRRSSIVLRGIGAQFFVWGAIDSILAWFGLRNSTRDEIHFRTGHLTTNEVAGKGRGLRRLLIFNTGMDVIYMTVGLRMMRSEKPSWYAAGVGVLIQGLFLFVFDLLFAERLRIPESGKNE